MKLVDDWKKLWKSYSVLAITANVLQALSITALSVLGVLSNDLAFPLVVGLGVLFGVLGLIGRVIPQNSISGT